jgi:signal transduction histidine kinase/DNA-binding response OmpR family regulator
MNRPVTDQAGDSRQHILLVEDNPADARLIREMLVDHLGRDNFEMRVGESVGQALRLIDERLPDIVLLDLSVSDSFGLETLYKIQNRSHTLPVIVLTGNQDEKLALRAVKAGAQDYLAKHDLSGGLLLKTMQYARERKLNEAALRISEARFRSLAELSSDWYWEQDATHILTYLSEGLSDKCGIDPHLLIGHPWWNQRWCTSGNNDWSRLQAAMDAREPFQDIVISCGSPSALHLSISGMPVVEGGIFVGYRGLGKDVTARENAAAALRSSEERMRREMEAGREGVQILRQLDTLSALKVEAERANAAKSRFMAAVSHDLRQPMHALMLFLDNLKGAVLPGAQRQLVARMESALHSTQLLLDSILVMSRLENGMVAPNIGPFAIQPLLDRLRSFEGVAAKKGLWLRVRPSTAVVNSDIALLERIVSNLVSNALRYTDKGGVLVTCRRRRDGLLLEVWDTGRGIPKEHQESVFQEFFRIDRANGDGGGIGLGLTIVRSCSALLNCQVQLRSVPGRGSRFSVLIPFGEAPAHAVVLDAEEPDAVGAAHFAGLNVLLVDNDAAILEGTCSLLERWGCEVTKASSGPQADALLAHSARVPDLIISDLRLDDGELGTDLVMRVRRKYRPNLPAVLVSGDTSLQTAREVRRHGLKLLYKPLPPTRLRAVISNLLND